MQIMAAFFPRWNIIIFSIFFILTYLFPIIVAKQLETSKIMKGNFSSNNSSFMNFYLMIEKIVE
jgi:hypothetical protein